MKSLVVLFALLFTLIAVPAIAIQPDEMLKDPKLEARARSVDQELRCLVCQNENIDDSDADLAHDLRLLVRKRIMAGDNNDQVKQYIVARYGNYVLLKPPFSPETYLLWFGPVVLLLAAATVAVFYIRRQSTVAIPSDPLSPEEEGRIAALAGDQTKERT
ncbi:MAG: cytochrome c-type biogenesis protein CcmH [Alphaproteobacteria bacterium]|nr:cytochrome c-type biogenesis protein CcmH [Alphaproteobacteria bacterium]